MGFGGCWWVLVGVGGPWWVLVVLGGFWWVLVVFGGSWWVLVFLSALTTAPSLLRRHIPGIYEQVKGIYKWV